MVTAKGLIVFKVLSGEQQSLAVSLAFMCFNKRNMQAREVGKKLLGTLAFKKLTSKEILLMDDKYNVLNACCMSFGKQVVGNRFCLPKRTISFGVTYVMGRKRVPAPAAGIQSLYVSFHVLIVSK